MPDEEVKKECDGACNGDCCCEGDCCEGTGGAGARLSAADGQGGAPEAGATVSEHLRGGASDRTRPEPIVQGCNGMCVEYEQNWKRALADYRNLQKDVAKERVEMGAYATLRVVERFLPVLDYFKLAMSHKPAALADKSLENWANGVNHIQKQLEDALADLGLTPIKTVGEKFDAARHEAVGEEVADGKESGVIVKEVQSGYELAGKVIRPAKVITAK